MNSATLIIAVISIVICSLPFVIGRNNRKKRERALLSEMKKHSYHTALNISKYELFSNCIIGLDEKANVLCFLRKREAGDHFLEVEVANYAKVEVEQRSHEEGENYTKQTVIDELSLTFHPKTNANIIARIELYNRKEKQMLSGEFQLAQEWALFLNNRIK